MKESAKDKETAKKKVTRKANPQESYPRAGTFPVESEKELTAKSGSSALSSGYTKLEANMDPFDNERNYDRMCPDKGTAKDPEGDEERGYNQVRPAPGNGPKEKGFDKDGEDYGD